MQEAAKTGSRVAVFGAVSTIVAYFLRAWFDLPQEVNNAVIILVLGLIAWTDKAIHDSESKLPGLWPW